METAQLELVRDQMHQRREENLRQFAEHAPELYEYLKDRRPKNARINLSPEGVELFHHETRVYPEEPWAYAEKQVEQFLAAPAASTMAPDRPPERDTLQHDYMRRVATLSPLPDATVRSYHFDRQNVPVFVVLGIGLGFHLEILVERLNIRHLLLYEPDPDIFVTSLYCIDWGPIFEYFNVGHRKLNILLGEQVDKRVDAAIDALRSHNPVFATVSYFYEHYKGEHLQRFTEELKHRISLSVRGFGFYDDERRGLDHTLANSAQQVRVLQHRGRLGAPSAAFIVGAGPSLDHSLETIRRHRDHAVVFSCGTSLGTLLANGIAPDFHLEQERPDWVADALRDLDRDGEIKGIDFIGLNVCSPRVFELFSRKLMALKANDTGALMFPPDAVRLTYCNPTVTNFGLSLALFLGFSDTFLFGVDLGAKDPETHHAQGTVYNTNAKWGATNWSRDLLDHKLPGNFGGEVFSRAVYLWTMDVMTKIIAEYPGARVFNCSDGALIKGAAPLRGENLELAEATPGAADQKARVRTGFTSKFYKKFDVGRSFRKVAPEILAAVDFGREVLARPITKRSDLYDSLDDIYFHLYRSGYHPAALMHIRGAFLQIMLLIYTHTSAEKEDSKALAFANQACGVFSEFLEEIRNDVRARAGLD